MRPPFLTRPGLRKLLAWLLPLPLATLPWLSMVVMNDWRFASPPWKASVARFAYDASKFLIGPGLICGLPLRSDWAIVGFAGLFWYSLGVAILGAILLRKKEQKAVAIPAWLALAWMAVILLLMFMFRNFNPD